MTRTFSLSETPGLGIAGFFAGCAGLLKRLLTHSTLAMFAMMAISSAASAETLLMPKRDARVSAPVVVWGVHDQAGSPACALNFGDLSAIQNCTGVDRSYIAYPHTYAGPGTYTVVLTVGVETTMTTIQVFDPALLVGGVTGDNNRSLGINMAIQDGLRYLWTSQSSRAANFPASTTTFWNNTGFPYADTSLAVLGFENQGYKLVANVAPTGIYEKYIVRRGLNYVLTNLSNTTLTVQTAGDPCSVYGPAPCLGYQPPGDTGYTTALAIMSIAGSGVPAQINTEVTDVAGRTMAGKTYGEILQRMLNTLIWGQNDSGSGQGGWDYSFNSTRLDGSTVGWDTVAILDATSAGAVLPAFAIAEYKKGLDCALNTDGSYDYSADCAPAVNNNVGPQKNGIGLQGLFLVDPMQTLYATTPARIAAVKANLSSWFPTGIGGIGGNVWGGCGPIGGAANYGCAYTMYNNFKGLKLQNIVTLPGVTRPAGPGAQPAGDWYASYQDWLVSNQVSPTTTAGGSWSTMGFSCCGSGADITAAIAELILSPVALVAPDPVLFSSVGLSPAVASNPVGTNHTVTAFTQAANGSPVPGVTIDFKVLTGPNAGKTGTGTTGADGKTTFTYHDDGGAGTDKIQAFIGTTLSSNQVLKIWGLACDVNGDGVVSPADLLLIRGRNNTVATGPTDPFDANRDGVINVADVRYCQLRMTAATP